MVNTNWTNAELRRAAGLKKRATNREMNAAAYAADILMFCEDKTERWGEFDFLLPALTQQVLYLINEDIKRKGGPRYVLTVDGPPDASIPRTCWEREIYYDDDKVLVRTVLLPEKCRLC